MHLLTFATLISLTVEPGRFLYANDDDWDFVAKLGASKRSALSTDYGEPGWSALDWAEAGLTRPVKGIVVGDLPQSPPVPVETLKALRGGSWSTLAEKPGAIAAAVKRKPDVILLKKETHGPIVQLDDADRRAIVSFVQSGGRLVVLDDFSCFGPVVAALLEVDPVSAHHAEGLSPAASPPMPGAPDPRGMLLTPVGAPPPPFSNDDVKALASRFEALGVVDTATFPRNAQKDDGLALRVVLHPKKR